MSAMPEHVSEDDLVLAAGLAREAQLTETLMGDPDDFGDAWHDALPVDDEPVTPSERAAIAAAKADPEPGCSSEELARRLGAEP